MISYGMASSNAGIEDVGAGTETSTVIVDVVSVARSLMGDASKTPGCAGLGDISLQSYGGILLNKVDLYTC